MVRWMRVSSRNTIGNSSPAWPTQQTKDIESMLIWCWSSVADYWELALAPGRSEFSRSKTVSMPNFMLVFTNVLKRHDYKLKVRWYDGPTKQYYPRYTSKSRLKTPTPVTTTGDPQRWSLVVDLYIKQQLFWNSTSCSHHANIIRSDITNDNKTVFEMYRVALTTQNKGPEGK